MNESEFFQVTVDKFVFRVARDRRYHDADVWTKRMGDRARVGLGDFLQQKSGDIAFIELKPIGTMLTAGAEMAAIETIKVDLIVPAPLAGTIVAVNTDLATHPEWANEDCYRAGWLVEIEPRDWKEFDALLDAETYLPQLRARAELERER